MGEVAIAYLAVFEELRKSTNKDIRLSFACQRESSPILRLNGSLEGGGQKLAFGTMTL